MIRALLMRIVTAPLRNPSAHARELALAGHAKRKADVRAVARQIRRETGQPPHPALEA